MDKVLPINPVKLPQRINYKKLIIYQKMEGVINILFFRRLLVNLYH